MICMSILVAVGDDDRFESVLSVAVRLAEGLSQELTVAHVTANEVTTGKDHDFRDRVQSFLSDSPVRAEVTFEQLSRSGIRSGTAIGKQLIEITEDVSVEHVVIGHRSKTQLAELRDGHTGFVVAEESAVPVTIVPESAAD
jgi:K+-sensing histidine kinase KdpD|nr:universal stress protein [uncultured haloarchaeon FLAS10H9]